MEVFHNFIDAVEYYQPKENDIVDLLITKEGVVFPLSVSFKYSEEIIFFFPGAFDNTKTKPKFQRKSYFKDITCTAVSFFDPTLFLSSKLISAWFQGEKDKDYIPLLNEIVREIITFFKVINHNIFFFASSSGGIPAMKIAQYYTNCNVYLGNIQTDIMRHKKNRIDRLLKYIYGGVSDLAEVYHRLNIFNVNENINVVFAQNILDDYHYENHFKPFLQYAVNTKMNCQFITYKHEASGHSPISPAWEKRIINTMLSRSNLKDIYKDSGYLIDYIDSKPKNDIQKKKHILIGIRYSILSKNLKGAWKLSNENSFDEYKKKLFSDERLNYKARIFEMITLPSLIHLKSLVPNNITFKVQILTSEELPENQLIFLNSLNKKYEFLEIRKLSVEHTDTSHYFSAYLDDNVKLGEMYASVRLDDDDALSSAWLNNILQYLEPEYKESVVSLSGGYALALNSELKQEKMIPWKWRFSSAGLTYIGERKSKNNINIYACGSHSRTDDKYRTILDSSGRSFLRLFGHFSDSKDKLPLGIAIEQSDVEKILLNDFGIRL